MNAIVVSRAAASLILSLAGPLRITGRITSDGRVAFSADHVDTIRAAGVTSAEADLIAWDSVSLADAPEYGEIPPSISPRQARLWLVSHDVTLASVDAAIGSISDDVTRESVRVEWEYGLEVQRSSPWLSALGAALGLDDDAIDQAFREASIL